MPDTAEKNITTTDGGKAARERVRISLECDTYRIEGDADAERLVAENAEIVYLCSPEDGIRWKESLRTRSSLRFMIVANAVLSVFWAALMIVSMIGDDYPRATFELVFLIISLGVVMIDSRSLTEGDYLEAWKGSEKE